MKVGIIGGGVAGICAAIAAQKKGADVTILEAAPHLGGRAAGKGKIDTGRHLVTSAYFNFLQLTDILNSTGILSMLPQAYGSFEKSRIPFWFLKSSLPGSVGLATNLLRSGLLPAGEWLSSLLALNKTMKTQLENGTSDTNLYHLPDQTVDELLKKTRWPKSLLEGIGKPLAMGIMNGPLDSISAEPFHHALMLMMNDENKTAGWIRGDYGDLITKPASSYCLSNNIELILKTRVTGLKRSGKSWIIETTSENNRLEFDTIVLTLPPWQLSNLEVSEELVSLKAMAALVKAKSIVTTRVHTDKLEALPGPVSEGAPDYGIWFFEPSDDGILIERVASGIDPEGLQKSDVFREVFAQKLKQQFKLEVDQKIDVRPYKYATPLLGPKTPRPEIAISNGLFYAGDWANTGLPATLEGAAQAGWHAGNLI